jgi:hypothetical protein
MADLFAGAPEEWLQAADDTAHQYLTKPVIDWLHDQTIKAQAQRAQDEMVRRQENEALMARHADPTRGTVGGEPMAWDTRHAAEDVANKYAIAAAKKAENEQLMARHADPNWKQPPQFGAGFDQWARNKVDNLGDVSNRVAQTARDSVGSLADVASGSGQE